MVYFSKEQTRKERVSSPPLQIPTNLFQLAILNPHIYIQQLHVCLINKTIN